MSAIAEIILGDPDLYYGLMMMSFGLFGIVIKPIKSEELRKWLGTCIGIIALFTMLGLEDFYYFTLYVIVCVFIIKVTGKGKCHIAAFAFTFTAITIFRFVGKIACPNPLCCFPNMIFMMVTLKLVGVAFEIHNSDEAKKHPKKENEKKIQDIYDLKDASIIDPTVMELLHYSFSYLGQFNVPYITYRTHDDYIKLPFSKAAGNDYFFKKIGWANLYSAICLYMKAKWPPELILTAEFAGWSQLYRCVYVMLQWWRFQAWLFAGLCLGEASLSGAGLGAYPVQAACISTHGPTAHHAYKHLREITYDEAKTLSYDFTTIKSVNVFEVQTSWSVKGKIKAWNMSVQYFMGMYLYKIVPKTRFFKHLRIPIVVMLSALWHGISLGYFVGMITGPCLLLTEAVYKSILEKITGWKSRAVKLFWYLCNTYVAAFASFMCALGDKDAILQYLESLQYTPYIFHVCVHVLGLAIYYIFIK